MVAVGFATLAAFCFAGSSVAVVRGVHDTSVFGGLIVSLGVGTALSGFVVLLSEAPPTPRSALLGYVGAGIFGSGIGWAMSMAGVSILGASRAVPLQGAIYPLAAIAWALSFLGERVSSLQVAGAVAIAVGIALLSRVNPLLPKENETYRPKPSTKALFVPLGAGLSFALADVLRNSAADSSSDPILGAAVATITGLVLWSIVAVSIPKLRARITFGTVGVRWFATSGVLTAVAVFSATKAFETGDVSIVAPLIAAQPLPVLLLSSVFLKKRERLSALLIVGAICVVLGAGLLSLNLPGSI